MTTKVSLSTIATLDDIRRCMQVLTDGLAEEEFLKVLQMQDEFRLQCLTAVQEAQRIQRELDASLESMADLETKLFRARRLLDMETKARKQAEMERDQMERKILAVADLLQHESNLKNETKDKLANAIHTLPRKRKSLNPHLEERFGNEINSTGSFLSNLSITQSEDDFLDVNTSRNWHKHIPSVSNAIPYLGNKKSRLSIGAAAVTAATAPPNTRRSARKSSLGVHHHHHHHHQSQQQQQQQQQQEQHQQQQQQLIDILPGSERICATTKVTIPQDGSCAIRAESTIESVPVTVHREDIPANHPDVDGVPPMMTPKRSSRFIPSNTTATVPTIMNLDSPGIPAHLRTTGGLKRSHNFVSKTFIRGETCVHCQKKIRFGSVGLRCRDCPVRCHGDCKSVLNVMCVPQSSTPTGKGLMGYIVDYAPTVAPMVPALIVHCVNEIESRGFNEVGVYRVSGAEREVKSLKERFLRGKTTPNLTNTDIHVLCGCIKDFLRSLIEPLIPTNLWKDFCNAAQNPDEVERQHELYKAIGQLPSANRDTLAFLILHFQRIAECREVLMPLDNIARVFGPTIVGYSSSEPDQHAIFTEVYAQYTVMLNLLKIPSTFWNQYIDCDTDKENSNNAMTPMTPTPNNNQQNKDSIYSLYATPFKSTLKKRKFYENSSHQKK